MTRNGRVLLPLALLALAGAAGCRRARTGATAPRQTMEDFTLSQTARGQLLWELKARTAVLHEESSEALLTEPRMQFYQGGKLASRVRSLSGRVSVETHDVFLSSSVVLDAIEDRSVLRTETLNYNSKRDLFLTDAPVQVERPEGRLLGRGLQAKPDLSEIRVFNQRSEVEQAPK